MSNVCWMLEVQVNEGQGENFRTLMEEMVAGTREGEPGTLTYEWYLDDAGSVCHVWERYQDSAAALVHLNGLQPHLARFLEVCSPKGITVYGSPTDEVRNTLAVFGPLHLAPAAGFRR